MKLLIQRVRKASVSVEGEVIGQIGCGLLILAGFGGHDDLSLPESKTWETLIRKAVDLRIFPDTDGKMNLGLQEYGGEILIVSQFTLYADCRKGKRPSFTKAAAPEIAETLYDLLIDSFKTRTSGKVQTGRFGAEMDICLTNWGPVTIELSDEMLTRQ
ncbi:D-aminoacyl-tRNA deacylase [Oleidesulfovibrio sp.]|uniref:D-aminoacyl-tRNA deacylase n=1 Tax=Oleidesulfovibrio sp. TaxID=2909707 RepID=UPI003A849C07